jgi:hypothetical protein
MRRYRIHWYLRPTPRRLSRFVKEDKVVVDFFQRPQTVRAGGVDVSKQPNRRASDLAPRAEWHKRRRKLTPIKAALDAPFYKLRRSSRDFSLRQRAAPQVNDVTKVLTEIEAQPCAQWLRAVSARASSPGASRK